MSLILETRDLAKTYGQFQAVKGMSLQVEQGAIYGFVGPNGAGKTTTMRIITTLHAYHHHVARADLGRGLCRRALGAQRP